MTFNKVLASRLAALSDSDTLDSLVRLYRDTYRSRAYFACQSLVKEDVTDALARLTIDFETLKNRLLEELHP